MRLLLALALLTSAASAQSGGLVVLNKAEATASLVDLASGLVVATLPTGTGPHEVAVSPDGRTAVVSNYGDQTTVGASLTVLDLMERRVERTISTGAWERPHGLAFLSDDRLAVTAERDSAVVVVDLGAGRVISSAATGGGVSHMVALAPDGRHAYTANIGSGTVSRIDLDGGQPLTTAFVGPYTEAIAVRPDGSEVWAASQETGRVVALDAETLAEVGAVTVTGRPIRIAFTPDARRVLVTSVESSTVTLLDADTRAVVGEVVLPITAETANEAAASVPGSALPVGTAVAADGGHAYVAMMGRNQVAEIDLGTLAVTRWLDVGSMPDGIAVVSR